MGQTVLEVMTGRMRPRHRRFQRALEQLARGAGFSYQLRQPTIAQRLTMQLTSRLRGLRETRVGAGKMLTVLHQALSSGTGPYVAEFDVPLALHAYNIAAHQRAAWKARELMERRELRALLVFSDWARRSFELHFGSQVGAKCRTVYPLAFEGAFCGSFEERTYDFAFISTSFRIKSGPEVVRAFARARRASGRNARMCVVTRLSDARGLLGNLEKYEGVKWCEATLGERQIADLLANTRCLVHPSLSDSFGVVVMEALAAGCAVISSDIASFPEMVRKENGWLLHAPTATVVGDTYITEYGDVKYHERYLNTLSLHRFEEAIEEGMMHFLGGSERAHAMMVASRSLYEAEFSLEAWIGRMKGVLGEAFPEAGFAER